MYDNAVIVSKNKQILAIMSKSMFTNLHFIVYLFTYVHALKCILYM